MGIQCLNDSGVYGEYWRGTYQEFGGNSLTLSPPSATTCTDTNAIAGADSGSFTLSGNSLQLQGSGSTTLTMKNVPPPPNYNPTATEPYTPQKAMPNNQTSYRGCFKGTFSPANFVLMTSAPASSTTSP